MLQAHVGMIPPGTQARGRQKASRHSAKRDGRPADVEALTRELKRRA